FWEQALPGSPMPDAIADGVQRGIDHSPLVEHYTASPSISACTLFDSTCTTGNPLFAECKEHSAKPCSLSAKGLPSVTLGKPLLANSSRQRGVCREPNDGHSANPLPRA
ncbi:hypothetical protein EJB05_53498, partial [Eragrostis curvula]